MTNAVTSLKMILIKIRNRFKGGVFMCEKINVLKSMEQVKVLN